MNDLQSRMDSDTRLVMPDLHGIARRLGISHAAIRRVARTLHDNGTIESVSIPVSPGSSSKFVRYRI